MQGDNNFSFSPAYSNLVSGTSQLSSCFGKAHKKPSVQDLESRASEENVPDFDAEEFENSAYNKSEREKSRRDQSQFTHGHALRQNSEIAAVHKKQPFQYTGDAQGKQM